MTAITLTIERDRVRVATDSLVYSFDNGAEVTRYGIKAWHLVHYDALLICCGARYVGMKVAESVNSRPPADDFDGLVPEAVKLWQRHSADYNCHRERLGMPQRERGTDLFLVGYSPRQRAYTGWLVYPDTGDALPLPRGWYFQSTMQRTLPQPVPRRLDFRQHLGIIRAWEDRAMQTSGRGIPIDGQAIYYSLGSHGLYVRRLGEIEADHKGLERFLAKTPGRE